MLDYDIVAVRAVFPFQPAKRSIFFHANHYPFPCSKYPGAGFHIEIQRRPLTVREGTKIPLYDTEGFSFFKRKVIHVARIILYQTLLQQLYLLAQGILAGSTTIDECETRDPYHQYDVNISHRHNPVKIRPSPDKCGNGGINITLKAGPGMSGGRE
jgi:hypothetical protein